MNKLTIMEVIEERMKKYEQLKKPSQTEYSRHGYDSAWWALQDLKEIIEQNDIKEVK